MPDIVKSSGLVGNRLFGLIGYPLAQSFSKQYFTEKFQREDLNDCHFENFPIRSINEFPDIIHSHTSLQGMAVTIPYKQAVLPFLTSADNIPAGLNACNCIRISNGELVGFNTDHIGFEKSFTPLLKPYHKKALVLGNGGSTEAVVFVLKKYHIQYTIVSRSLHGASSLTYEDIDEKLIQENQVIINTTPLGMYPDTANCPSIPYALLSSGHYLYDLVYNPAKTMFLQKGEERGAIIKSGADMLEIQAEENWRIWNEH